ncbi:hypothetical protein [Nannocystis pusilla]|uniref:hypothetical protein n=1 Tax=Nannocystis pusilla TaxID=889268 RepID=UPI003B7F1DC8
MNPLQPGDLVDAEAVEQVLAQEVARLLIELGQGRVERAAERLAVGRLEVSQLDVAAHPIVDQLEVIGRSVTRVAPGQASRLASDRDVQPPRQVAAPRVRGEPQRPARVGHQQAAGDPLPRVGHDLGRQARAAQPLGHRRQIRRVEVLQRPRIASQTGSDQAQLLRLQPRQRAERIGLRRDLLTQKASNLLVGQRDPEKRRRAAATMSASAVDTATRSTIAGLERRERNEAVRTSDKRVQFVTEIKTPAAATRRRPPPLPVTPPLTAAPEDPS